MVTSALDVAALIASKSPVAVQGSKVNLVYSRDHSVDESLRYIVSVSWICFRTPILEIIV